MISLRLSWTMPWLVWLVVCCPVAARAQLGIGGAIAEANRVVGAGDAFLGSNDCVAASNAAAYGRILSDAEDIDQTLRVMWKSLATDNNGRVPWGPPRRGFGGGVARGAILGPVHAGAEPELQEAIVRVDEAIQALKKLAPCRSKPSIRATPSIQLKGNRYAIEGFYAGSGVAPRDPDSNRGRGSDR